MIAARAGEMDGVPRPSAERGRLQRYGWLIVALLCFGVQSFVFGANMVQEFFLPMPEQQVKTAFTTIRPAASNTMVAVFSIVITGDGTVVTYDHWEDGYETDINNPVQSNTRIWGDGNDANGICPGFAHDPTNGLAAGTVIALRNDVPLPRNPSTILYDARDRVAASKAITVSRACWAKNVGTVQASAAEVLATMDHDNAYIAPVGEDVLFNNIFQYVGLLIMADQDNTTVTIDTDGTGTVAAVSIVLNRGETYQVNGGIKKGATVVGTKPIQVHMMTGNKTVSYESRSFVLRPTTIWDDKYLTAVGTAPNGNQAYAFLYSTNSAAVTVNYTTRAGSGTLTIPGGGNGHLQWQLPQNSGTLLQSAGGQKFFVICTAGAQPGNSAAFDWGFSLMPFDGLTTEAVVGWGPGSNDGTQNGSPVWITPLANTTIYVDYRGDHAGSQTDPLGGKCDAILTNVVALESRRVYDAAAKDQTGMRLYTVDGTPIAAMWGEDPSVAQPGNPYLDMGTIVLPFPIPTFTKTCRIVTDTGPVGYSTNDVLEYTLTVENKGLLPLGNTVVMDELPASLSYITNSTTWNGNPIADHADATPFSLGPPQGYTVPIILRGGSSVFTFQSKIMSTGSIVNSGFAGSLTATNVIVVPGPNAPTNTPSTSEFTLTANGPGTPTYTVNDRAFLRVTDLDQNTTTTAVDTITVTVRDDVSGDYQNNITLWETGVNTGVFTGSVPTSATSGGLLNDGTVLAPAGSTLTLTYTDPTDPSDVSTDTALMLAPPPPTLTKILYLSDPTQALDRIDPVAVSDNTTTQTVVLGAGTSTIVVNSPTSTASRTTSGNLTFSHTTGTGTNRFLLVGVAYEDDTPGTGYSVTGVTYGGISLTRAIQRVSSEEAVGEIWYLVNPPSGTSNVVVSTTSWGTSDAIFAGAITYAGVNQSTPLGTITGVVGRATSASIVVPSATGELVFDHLALDDARAVTVGSGQTQRWNGFADTSDDDGARSAASTEAGSNSVTMSWTGIPISDSYALCAVSIKPAAGIGGVAAFTQAPPFALSFTMPAGGVLRVTNYVSVVSGSMPASPNITATLGYSNTTFLVLSNPTYSVSGSASNLVWSGSLPGTVNVPTNQSIWLRVSSSEPAATFRILYDSATYPSKILLPTTNVIAVTSLAVYDAPYPGTNQVISAPCGDMLYVRATVTDPFGGYDISGMTVAINGPGGTAGAVLTDSSVVASNSSSKTYEYAWFSSAVPGSYDITVTAREGTEGITNSASTTVQLIFTDFGTPSTTFFTTGPNGPATTAYQTNEIVYVRVTDADQNINTTLVESVTVTITNQVSGDSETRTLWETGPNSGVFTGGVSVVTNGASTANNGILTTPPGSILLVTYVDPNDSSDTSNATATVPTAPGVPGLTVQKTLVSPASGQALVGDSLQFQILVMNSGSTTQSTVSVVDTYPAVALRFDSSTPAPDTNTAGRLTWNNVGPLNPGQQATISLAYTATNGLNPATNTAVATGTGISATGRVTFVVINPQLVVTKTLVSPAPGPGVTAGVGDSVSYRIVVRNNGNSAIAVLPLEDTFSGAYYTFSSATIPPDGVGAGSLLWNDLTGPGTNLAVGAAITNVITLVVTGGGNPAQNVAAVNYAVDVFGKDVPPGSSTTGIVTRAVTISGGVYYDFHTNGVFDVTNDVGIAAVTLALYADAAGTGTPTGLPLRITATLANGTYEFLNLPTGRYVVVETDLPGEASSGDRVPPNDNRIPLNATNLVAYTNNWFLDYIPALTNYATVSGTVWNDLNGDGINNDGSVVLSGVTIDLIQDVNSNGVADVGESVIQSTATLTNGTYYFGAVTPGRYVIRETDPFWYVSTSTNQLWLLANGGSFSNRDFFDRAMAFGFALTKVQTLPAGGTNAAVGAQMQFTFSISNTGDVTLATVPLTDTFDTNILQYVSATKAPTTTTPAGTLYWADLGPLAGGAATNVTVTFNAIGSTGAGTSTNKVVATPTTPPDQPPAGPPKTNNVPFGTGRTGYTLTKVQTLPAGGTNAAVGAQMQFTFSISNTGDVTLATVPLTDTFDTNILQYVSATKTPTTTTPAGTLYWADLGPLAGGAATNVTVTFNAIGSTAGGTSTNKVVATPTTPPGNPPQPPKTNNVPFGTGRTGYTLTKVQTLPAGGTNAAVGAQMQFTFSISNTGDVTLATVPLTDTFDTNILQYVTASKAPTSTTPAGTLYWADLGPLTGGAATNVTVTFNAVGSTGAGTSTNKVVAVPTTPPGNPPQPPKTNNVPFGTGRTGYTLTKVQTLPAGGTNAAVGAQMQFTFSISNTGDVTLATVPLTDTFDTNILQYVSATKTPTSTTPAGTLFWSNLGPLAGGAATNVTVTFNAIGSTGAGTSTNKVVAVPTTPPGNPPQPPKTNNVPFGTGRTGYTLTKVQTLPAGGTNAAVGAQMQFTFSISNTGDVTLATVPLTDTFDTNILQYVTATTTPTSTTPAGTLYWADLGPLAGGAATNVTVTFNAIGSTAGGTSTNKVVATPTTPPGNPPQPPKTNNVPFGTGRTGYTLTKVQTLPAGGTNAAVGAQMQFTFSISNTGDVTLATVPLTDTFDTNILQYVSATRTPTTTTPAGTLFWSNLGPLAGGAATNVTVTFNAVGTTAGGTSTNKVVATPTTPPGNPPQPPKTNNVPFGTGRTGYTLTKVQTLPAGGTNAAVGAQMQFTFSISNTGDVTLATVPLTDTFDTNILQYVTATKTPTSTTPAGTLYWADLGPLAGGAATNVTVTFNAVGSTGAGTSTNMVVAVPTTPPGNPPEPPKTNSVPFGTGKTGYTLTKVQTLPAGGTNAAVGAQMQFTFSISNTGDVTLATVPLTDTFDTNILQYVTATTTPTSTTPAGTLFWSNLGPLAGGAATNVTVTFNAVGTTGAGTSTNKVVAVPTTPPGNPPQPPKTNSVPFGTGKTGYTLTKVQTLPAGGTNAAVGAQMQFTFSISNTGDVTLATVPLTDTFDTNILQYVSATKTPTSTTPAGTLFWSNLGPLAGGAATNVTVTFNAIGSTGAGTSTNKVVAVPTTPPGNPPQPPKTNNVPFGTGRTGYTLTKVQTLPAGGTNAAVGAQMQFTFSISNTGDVTLATVPLTDTFDTNILQYVSATKTPTTTTPAGTLYWADLGPLAGGAATNVTVTFNAVGSTGAGTSTNKVVAVPTTPPGNPPEPPKTNNVPFGTGMTGYTLTKVQTLPAGGTNAAVGAQMQFTFSISNTGDVTLATVPLTDTFDTNILQYVSATKTPTSTTPAGTLFWSNLGPLAGGAATNVTVTFNAIGSTGAGTSTNKVVAVPTTPPGNPPQPPKTNSVPFGTSSPGFSLSKVQTAPSGRSAVVGETVQWTISVTNTGDVAFFVVPLSDTYSTAMLHYVSANPPPNTPTDGALVWTNIGPLAVGASTNVVVTLAAVGGGSGTNTVVLAPTTPPGQPPVSPKTNNVPFDINVTLVIVSEHGIGTSPVGVYTNLYGTVLTNRITGVDTQGRTQYVSTGWTMTGNGPASGSATNVTLTLTNNAVLTWQWQTQYLLDTATNGNGSVSQPDQWVNAGSNVTVVATPGANWHFTGWTGQTNGCPIVGNVITAAMTQARSITANFAIDQKTLTIISAHGVGTQPASPTGIVYTNNYGTVLTERITGLDIQGRTQYVATGWTMTGNAPAAGGATNVTLTLTNNAVLTWLWNTNYLLNATADPHGAVQGSTNGWYASGAIVTVTGTPVTVGWHFVSWTGDITGPTNAAVQTLTMNQARTLVAHFAPNPRVGIVKTQVTPNNGYAAQVGESVVFRIAVTNLDDVVLDTVKVEDVYETTYLTYTNATPSAVDTNNDGVITWANVGPLAPRASTNLYVMFRATAGTALQGTTNTAVVTPTLNSGVPVAPKTNAAIYLIDNPIEVDNVSTGSFPNATVGDVTHTVFADSTNHLLIVGVSVNNSAEAKGTVTNVFYSGIPMTLLGTRTNDDKFVPKVVSIWGMVNPPVGTATVRVRFNNKAPGNGWVVGAITFRNVNTAAPYGAFSSSIGSTGNPTIAGLASSFGEVILDTVAVQCTALTTSGVGQTQRWSKNSLPAPGWGGGSTKAGAASVTMSWTATGNTTNWVVGALAIRPNRTLLLASSQTALQSSHNPSTFGEGVTFTATVTGAGGTPTGTVQFKIDGVNSGSPVALVAGTAISSVFSSLAAGTHTVTAVYSGDSTHTGSVSEDLYQEVGSSPALVISAIRLQEGHAVVEWPGTLTWFYTVETTGSLLPPVSWTNLANSVNIPGVSGTMSATDTNVLSEARFYRVWMHQ